jgi:hypothetical protein
MDEPSAQGPQISHLRFVPAENATRCPVDVRFRLETATEDIVSAQCAWVRRHGRSAEPGRSTLPVDPGAIRAGQTDELEARLWSD